MKSFLPRIALTGLLFWTAAAPGAELPVKKLVLYTSGVGFFEHEGTVEANDSCTMNFTAEQLNDLLKTLVIRDFDGGSIGPILYPAQNPLDKALEAFPINVSGNLTRAALLQQLRGAEVKLELKDNKALHGGSVQGTVLGVEVKASQGQLPVESVSLLTADGIEAIDLETIRNFAPTDPRLIRELGKALSVLASDRDGNRKPFTIEFRGEGRRRVRFGYTLETPIWKTSYRLVFDPAEPGKAFLQGWAIVENQTDSDWKELQLSLVSGDPAFLYRNLYQSQYRQRPGRMVAMKEKNMSAANGRREAAATPAIFKNAISLDQAKEEADAAGSLPIPESAPAVESGRMGELFEYRIEQPVTLERRQSTMLELLSEQIPAEKLLLFNREDGQRHPYNGALLENTSDKLLLEGPLAVYDQNSYSGDSTLPNLVASGDAVIRYSLALDVKAETRDLKQHQEYSGVKFARGVLETARTLHNATEYKFINQSKEKKSLLLYVRQQPQWELLPELKPWKTENGFYRFRLTLEPEGTLTFPVEVTHTVEESIQLQPDNWEKLGAVISRSKLTEEQRRGWEKAAELHRNFTVLQRKSAQLKQQLEEMDQNVSRTRRNINALSGSDEFRRQLITRLNDEIQKLDTLQQQQREILQQCNEAQSALENYLATLEL